MVTFKQVYEHYDGRYGDLVEAYVKVANSYCRLTKKYAKVVNELKKRDKK